MTYEKTLRPWLFRMDPEVAHHRALGVLALADALPLGKRALAAFFVYRDPALVSTVAGLTFPNPVGLAAGFDKDCRLAGVLPSLGFGFVETGTVTFRPQPGNPRPRVFRFPEAEALINRLGFNSAGAQRAAANLARLRAHAVPVGVNIGLNKDAKPEDAPQEYAKAFATLYPHGDYFTVNVSSPNTEGLRRLQARLALERILLALAKENRERKPVFVKLSPDLEDSELRDLIPLLEKESSGVICANTTVSRPGMPDEAVSLQGGLSGAPLRDLSTRMIREVYRLTGGRLPIIGAGGIFTAEDAYQKLRAGASLVQVYTGLIYKGPGLAAEINRGLSRLLRDHGLSRVGDAVGKSHPEIARLEP